MRLFEHLLLRLERSSYSSIFVLKGRLLISSVIGLARRTTMNMDTAVVGMPMGRKSVERAIIEIYTICVDDGMEYRLERVEPIREHDKYANWRAHISVLYGRMNPPVKIDITTGDSITPAQIEYPYPRMFDEDCIAVMSYPMATTLAEKFETVVSRGSADGLIATMNASGICIFIRENSLSLKTCDTPNLDVAPAFH